MKLHNKHWGITQQSNNPTMLAKLQFIGMKYFSAPGAYTMNETTTNSDAH